MRTRRAGRSNRQDAVARALSYSWFSCVESASAAWLSSRMRFQTSGVTGITVRSGSLIRSKSWKLREILDLRQGHGPLQAPLGVEVHRHLVGAGAAAAIGIGIGGDAGDADDGQLGAARGR